MTPAEKLKEIEEWHYLPETIKQIGPQSFFDGKWLINRVKRLTEALNNAETDLCIAEKYEAAQKARKALEDE